MSRARVLVAGQLADFLRATPIPDDIHVELLAEGDPVPEGDGAVGLLTLLTRPIGAEEMDRLTQLRVIANYGVGHDNIDVAAARARGIGVANTPDALTMATAEMTWALILAAARRLPEGDRLARGGLWTGWHPTQLLGRGLDGRVLGIVGAGRIGTEVARRAPAFGMGVEYWSRSRSRALEKHSGARRVSLDELLAAADVVSLHVALTPETTHLIDAAALDSMKPDAILVNTARGPIVDEQALIEALESGRLRAAALDVYEREPAIPARLRALPNAVLMPHLGSATEGARRGMWELAWENLLRGVRFQTLRNPVADRGAPGAEDGEGA
ncbi:MAG TPA: D-glycerate dehydrogenase [Longimicrobiales bacterium]|nr:D-glycerate dehydrogenase [Longimicrobiales bacterium]